MSGHIVEPPVQDVSTGRPGGRASLEAAAEQAASDSRNEGRDRKNSHCFRPFCHCDRFLCQPSRRSVAEQWLFSVLNSFVVRKSLLLLHSHMFRQA